MKTSCVVGSVTALLGGLLVCGTASAVRNVAPAHGAPVIANGHGDFTYANGTVIHQSSSAAHSWMFLNDIDDACPQGSTTCTGLFTEVTGHSNGVDPMNCYMFWTSTIGAATLSSTQQITADCNFQGTDFASTGLKVPGDSSGNPVAFSGMNCSMPPVRTCAPTITSHTYAAFNVSPSPTTRRGNPSDGAPYPSTFYSHFTYLNGVVRHTYTGGTDNWDLYPETETNPSPPSTRSATIDGQGNANTGLTCWGVALDDLGGATIGNSTGTPPGCSGGAREFSTPSVTNMTTFIVTCQVPAAQSGCDPRIASLRYRM